MGLGVPRNSNGLRDASAQHLGRATRHHGGGLDLSGSGHPGVSIGRSFAGSGYAHLGRLPNLKTLYLNNADVRWTELRGLKQLNSLSLMMPTMSEYDVRQLQLALPDTYVSAAWGGGLDSPIQWRKHAMEKAR